MPQPLNVGFWNLENLFDVADAERDWPGDANRRARLERWLQDWDQASVLAKIDRLAEVIASLGELDLLGLCEVENASVLEQLVAHPALAERGYAVIHSDSPDVRGIDVALLYRPERLELLSHEAFSVMLHFPTREILHAALRVEDWDLAIDVYVNHWPSRSAGRWSSEPYRITAAEQVAWLVQNHHPVVTLGAIVMGDFNDDPSSRSVLEHLDASPRPPTSSERHALYNPWWRFLSEPDAGTFWYRSRWYLVDQILVSNGLDITDPRIVRAASTQGSHGEPVPFDRKQRTGTSDHYPVMSRVLPGRRAVMLAGGVDAVFNSRDRGAITRRILEEMDSVLREASDRPVALHVMMFSFTSETLARRLVRIVGEHPNVSVRLLADWTQLSDSGSHQAPVLARLADVQEMPNLEVRFKKDSPLRWSSSRGEVEYSYLASTGLNHHKGMAAVIVGQPARLLAGSFNWTDSGEWDNWENIVVLDDSSAPGRAVMRSWELEFEAFWNDGRASLTWEEARRHDALVREQLAAKSKDDSVEVVGLVAGEGASLSVLAAPAAPPRGEVVPISTASVGRLESLGMTRREARAIVAWRLEHGDFESVDQLAEVPGLDPETLTELRSRLSDDVYRVSFSARAPHEDASDGGYAISSEGQEAPVFGPDGVVDIESATLASGVLDMVRRAKSGEHLLLASYSLSDRVQSFAALVDALERGVELRVIVDGRGSRKAVGALQELRDAGAPVEVRVSRHRTMHHKFMVRVDSDDVWTGSANLSSSSEKKHSEDRFFFKNHPELAAAFIEEFEFLWSVLAP